MDAQESQIYIAIIVASFVIGSAVSYFFYSVLKHHKKVLQLERESSKAQVEMLENDRSRIAADLHDELAPMLVAVKMRINSFDLSNENDQEQLDKTNETINDIAKRMRGISFDLMPSTLQEKGLQTAVREFVNYMGLSSPLKIRLVLCSAPLNLNDQQTIHLYRIIQEIIHNTIKHAHAQVLTIGLEHQKDYLVLSTMDDGSGFNYKEQLRDHKGLGLRSLLNRVHLLKGEFLIDSKLEKGTAIRIQIPTNHG